MLPAMSNVVFASLGQCGNAGVSCDHLPDVCCRVQSSSWCTRIAEQDLHDYHAFMPKSQLGSEMPRGRDRDTASCSGSGLLAALPDMGSVCHMALISRSSDPAGELDPSCGDLCSEELDMLVPEHWSR